MDKDKNLEKENLEKENVKDENLENKISKEDAGNEQEEDSKKNNGETEENLEEISIGKIRLGVSNSNFSSQPLEEVKRRGIEKEVSTYDGDFEDETQGIDLIEEKYKTEEREEREDKSAKYGLKNEGFYNESSKNHYSESSLSKNDDSEIEVGSHDLKDLRNEEFYSIKKERENRKISPGLFRSESRTYFERKEKEYLA